MVDSPYTNCTLCPRLCGVDRRTTHGFCQMGDTPYVARAALHFGEEPCLVGGGGSGAVFFAGCNLRCIFCQNHEISRGNGGLPVDNEHLSEIFLRLQAEGAVNINLVTATHFSPTVKEAVLTAKEKGLSLPIVYNTSGYESKEALQSLSGVVDIYLPDLKYHSEKLAARYSAASDYPAVAEAALSEMLSQTGEPVFDESGVLLRGTVIRFLLLPNALIDMKAALKSVFQIAGNRAIYSLLSQYTPKDTLPPPLNRAVKRHEYISLIRYAESLGIDKLYTQRDGAVGDLFVPPFDNTGVLLAEK